MTATEWKNDFVESFVNVGVEKGRELGQQQGRREGVINAKVEDVLKLLDARHLNPTDAQRYEVGATTDLVRLRLLLPAG